MASRKTRSFRVFESAIAWSLNITLVEPSDSVRENIKKTKSPSMTDGIYVFRSPVALRIKELVSRCVSDPIVLQIDKVPKSMCSYSELYDKQRKRTKMKGIFLKQRRLVIKIRRLMKPKVFPFVLLKMELGENGARGERGQRKESFRFILLSTDQLAELPDPIVLQSSD